MRGKSGRYPGSSGRQASRSRNGSQNYYGGSHTSGDYEDDDDINYSSQRRYGGTHEDSDRYYSRNRGSSNDRYQGSRYMDDDRSYGGGQDRNYTRGYGYGRGEYGSQYQTQGNYGSDYGRYGGDVSGRDIYNQGGSYNQGGYDRSNYEDNYPRRSSRQDYGDENYEDNRYSTRGLDRSRNAGFRGHDDYDEGYRRGTYE